MPCTRSAALHLYCCCCTSTCRDRLQQALRQGKVPPACCQPPPPQPQPLRTSGVLRSFTICSSSGSPRSPGFRATSRSRALPRRLPVGLAGRGSAAAAMAWQVCRLGRLLVGSQGWAATMCHAAANMCASQSPLALHKRRDTIRILWRVRICTACSACGDAAIKSLSPARGSMATLQRLLGLLCAALHTFPLSLSPHQSIGAVCVLQNSLGAEAATPPPTPATQAATISHTQACDPRAVFPAPRQARSEGQQGAMQPTQKHEPQAVAGALPGLDPAPAGAGVGRLIGLGRWRLFHPACCGSGAAAGRPPAQV